MQTDHVLFGKGVQFKEINPVLQKLLCGVGDAPLFIPVRLFENLQLVKWKEGYKTSFYIFQSSFDSAVWIHLAFFDWKCEFRRKKNDCEIHLHMSSDDVIGIFDSNLDQYWNEHCHRVEIRKSFSFFSFISVSICSICIDFWLSQLSVGPL